MHVSDLRENLLKDVYAIIVKREKLQKLEICRDEDDIIYSIYRGINFSY